jgi:hypothetical protein
VTRLRLVSSSRSRWDDETRCKFHGKSLLSPQALVYVSCSMYRGHGVRVKFGVHCQILTLICSFQTTSGIQVVLQVESTSLGSTVLHTRREILQCSQTTSFVGMRSWKSSALVLWMKLLAWRKWIGIPGASLVIFRSSHCDDTTCRRLKIILPLPPATPRPANASLPSMPYTSIAATYTNSGTATSNCAWSHGIPPPLRRRADFSHLRPHNSSGSNQGGRSDIFGKVG